MDRWMWTEMWTGGLSSLKVTLSQKEAGVCYAIFIVCPKRVLLLCRRKELATSKGKEKYCLSKSLLLE